MSTTESTLSIEDVESKVRQLAAAQVGADVAGVTLSTSFQLDLNFDSLDQVEFVMTLEETYDLEIPDEEASQAKTVGDAVRLIRERRPT